MKLFPMYDNILVSRTETIQNQPSMFEVPDATKEKTDICKVLALGQGRVKKDGTMSLPTLKVGDTVLITKFSGIPLKIGKHTFIVLSEANILGIVGD